MKCKATPLKSTWFKIQIYFLLNVQASSFYDRAHFTTNMQTVFYGPDKFALKPQLCYGEKIIECTQNLRTPYL